MGIKSYLSSAKDSFVSRGRRWLLGKADRRLYFLNLNDYLVLPDEAKEDENHHDQDGHDDAPDQTLVSCALALHLLLELFVGHLNVFGSFAELFVHDVDLLPLQFGLVLDVSSELVDIFHDGRHHRYRLVPVLNEVCHLMGHGLLTYAKKKEGS